MKFMLWGRFKQLNVNLVNGKSDYIDIVFAKGLSKIYLRTSLEECLHYLLGHLKIEFLFINHFLIELY